MSLGSTCDISMVGNYNLACSESKWSSKGNMMNSEEKEVPHQEKEEFLMCSAGCSARWARGVQMMMEERRM
jgi:hypothetical protein